MVLLACRFSPLFGYSLPRNRLHVLANDVVVARPPIAEIGSHDKHVASEAEREKSFILERDIHAKNSVVDGMADVIDDLASYLGVLPAPHAQTFIHEFVQLPPLLGGYRGYGCVSAKVRGALGYDKTWRLFVNVSREELHESAGLGRRKALKKDA